MTAPDARHGRGEEEAQGAGEGGGAEVGGVEAHQAQVRAGHLQGGTLHGGALGHGGAAAPGACRGVQGISRYLHHPMTTHRRPCTGCRCRQRAGPRWDSPGAPPCPAPRTRCSSGRWGVSSEVSVQRMEVTVPGEGGQGRALELGHLHREAGGEAVLGPEIVVHSDIVIICTWDTQV